MSLGGVDGADRSGDAGRSEGVGGASGADGADVDSANLGADLDTVSDVEVAAEARSLADADTFEVADAGELATDGVVTDAGPVTAVDGATVTPVDGATVTPVDGLDPNAPGAPVIDPPASGILADPTLTRAELDTRLQAMTNPELTDMVEAVDTAQLGFGTEVTEQGWAALRDEVGRRFGEAQDAGNYIDQELAELSHATVRQGKFGELNGPWQEGQWRTAAQVPLAGADPDDPAANAVRDTIAQTETFISHRVGGSMPPELMTNRELLGNVDRIPGMRLTAELMGLTGLPGLLAPGMANHRAEALLGEVNQRMARGDIPLFVPDTGEAASANMAMAVSAVEVGAMLTPQGALRRGFRELFSEGGERLTANRIARAGGDAIVDPARMRQVGAAIADDPVATAAYAQLQRQGTRVIMDFDSPIVDGVVGQADATNNTVTLFMRGHSTAADAVATLVHESSHINRFFRGNRPSQLDEF